MTITCADCGSQQTIPFVPPGGTAECHRCDRTLVRRSSTGLDASLAFAIGMCILIFPAMFLPFLQSSFRNLLFEQSRLVSSVPVIYSQVWFPFAFGFFLLAFFFPALRAFLLVVVLGSIRTGWRVPQVGRIFRWSEGLRIWSMTEVVVIAGVITYYRAEIPAEVEVLVGAWCYLGVAVLAFAVERSLDKRAVWYAILPDAPSGERGVLVSCEACELAVARRRGDPCPRCGATLNREIKRHYIPALGALGAALPLAIPGFSFSVIVNDQLSAVLEHTILGTVQLLADHGYWQFGVLVLIAGIAIPLVTMLALLWLLARVRFPNRRGLVLRTRVYRLLVRMVRWPMIIPFIAAIAAPIIDYQGIDDIVAGPGATPLFMLMVFLMLALRLFNPRLMWKAAGEMR